LSLRTLTWRIQQEAFGEHDKATLRRLESYGLKGVGDQRTQQLKARTVLVREFSSTRHTITIVTVGFVWQEKTYSGLSAIAPGTDLDSLACVKARAKGRQATVPNGRPARSISRTR
jgi:hypothetical protein